MTEPRAEIPEKFTSGLTDADTLDALRAHVEQFAEYAKDALAIVRTMTDAEFQVFRKGLKSERRGQFAGVEFATKYNAVLMPEPMFTIARIASEYHVPFTVALRRIKDVRPDLLKVK